MCNHLTFLAQSGDWRYVAQCEHGTLHLTWGRQTLHLQPKDFLRVARFLEQANPGGESELNDGHNSLRSNRAGHFELWLLEMGLKLSPVDFLILVDIVQVATRQLQPPSKSRPQQYRKNRQTLDQLKRHSSPRFSPN